MVSSINTFHHLGIITRELEATVTRFEHLGFTFTPLSFPEFPLSAGAAPEPVGVANRHAIFKNSYLEMLGVVDAARWASISTAQRGPFDIDKPLKRYEGLHVMHYGTEDLDQVRVSLLGQRLEPSSIQPFQRMVDTPGGTAMMRARRLSFLPQANPETLFQIVQHETPDLVLQPHYMVHPNGALAISEAILCVENPAEVSARYGRYAGHPVEYRDGRYMVDLGEARLVVVDRQNLTAVLPNESAPTLPYMAGFTVTSHLDQVTEFMRRENIPFAKHCGRIIVSARDACGSAVVFERER